MLRGIQDELAAAERDGDLAESAIVSVSYPGTTNEESVRVTVSGAPSLDGTCSTSTLSRVAREDVGAPAAAQRGRTRPGDERVVARSSVDDAVAAATDDRGVARAADERRSPVVDP